VPIRESLNKNKNLGIGVGAAILIVAVGLIAFQLRGGGSGVVVATQAFYTDDNGKTFFKDNVYKVSPFDHNGKQAYRADVYQCTDGKQFAGVVYRHNALGRKGMEEHIAKGADDPEGAFLTGLESQGMEVKLSSARPARRPNW
jgi:hypothetical protein